MLIDANVIGKLVPIVSAPPIVEREKVILADSRVRVEVEVEVEALIKLIKE